METLVNGVPIAGRWRAVLALPLTGALGLMLSGCISMYVPNGLPEVSPSQYVKPAQPGPVQLLVDWTTQGKSNTKALGQVREDIVAVVKESGLFASTSPDPVPSNALLAITIDDTPITDPNSAFAKGFVTGFTFGLVGTKGAEGYTCTVTFIASNGAGKLTHETRQPLVFTMGAHAAPADTTPAPSIKDAVRTVIRRTVGNALKDLSEDPAFTR
jgi:hypothetical protein